jgi:glycosyltransferase involved in cell wall biosynthesis
MGAPKSLAIVTAFYPPSLGGVERYSQGFARAAVDLGLSVNVITTVAASTPESSEDGRVHVLRIPARYVPISGSYFPIPTSGARLMAQRLRADVIIAQTRFFLTTLMAARVAASQGRRICVVDHGAGPLRSNPAFVAASMTYEHVITLALRAFRPKFFAVSAASARWLRHFGIGEAPVVPNGVSPREGMPDRTLASFSKPVIFCAGRLFAEKGIRELVDAVGALVRGGAAIELRIAGDGPLSGMLAERAQKNGFLRYLGRISHDEVAAELERASLYVNPSNCAEGLPTVLLEAGSAALPVISTAFGGSSELILDGDTGWTIPRGDVDSIAGCIRDVLAQPVEAIDRGRRLFGHVQSNYTWPIIVKNFLVRADNGTSAR